MMDDSIAGDHDTDYEDDADDLCPRCNGDGFIVLISGLEWGYIGHDTDDCPVCGGAG